MIRQPKHSLGIYLQKHACKLNRKD